MARKILAVDVDLTVVDTLTPWLNWVHQFTGGAKVKNEDGCFDLVPEMQQLLRDAGNGHINSFDFWEDDRLYDDLQPLPGAVAFLYEFSGRYEHDVVFVSTCVPSHTASKRRFLRRWFPFAAGFIDTADKHFVDYDVIVDDKIEVLDKGNSQRPWAEHILFTQVRADGAPGEAARHKSAANWSEVVAKLGF